MKESFRRTKSDVLLIDKVHPTAFRREFRDLSRTIVSNLPL